MLLLGAGGHTEFAAPPNWHTHTHARACDAGGHTEFAARRCGDPEMRDVVLGAATPPALQVAPLPGR